MLFMLCVARWQGVSLRTRFAREHIGRGVVAIATLGTWFYALTFLPLVTANALIFTSSLWIAAFIIISRMVPRRTADASGTVNGWHIATVITGFAGVLLLLGPEAGQGELFAGIAGLFSGLLSAVQFMLIISLGKAGEHSTRTVFYWSASNVVGGAVWVLFTGHSEFSVTVALWPVLMGIAASLGAWCIVRAYSRARSHGSTLLIANLQYSEILFSAVFGIALFGERIPLLGWAGIVIIMVSGVVAAFIRERTVSALQE